MERRDAKLQSLVKWMSQTTGFNVFKTKQTEASQTDFSIGKTRHLLFIFLLCFP